ncbi:hypothetical protein K2X96_02840 [Patescibacteria group bacterium]|nr:hypothetical protein [Patescibacteria group bacterium]
MKESPNSKPRRAIENLKNLGMASLVAGSLAAEAPKAHAARYSGPDTATNSKVIERAEIFSVLEMEDPEEQKRKLSEVLRRLGQGELMTEEDRAILLRHFEQQNSR